MKTKNLLKIMALPLLTAACTSEDFLVENKADGQYADIAQVDVNFTVGADTRLASAWKLEVNDMVGLAWLGSPADGLSIDGKAYQNHPLYATSENSLQPKTSIYVGNYFSYYPYDYATKQIDKIKFSVAEQPLLDENSDEEAYKKTAAKSIWISPKFTNVTLTGDLEGKNQAGIDEVISISPRQFTNKAKLELSYKNNALAKVDPSEIYEIRVAYWDENGTDNKSVSTFNYAPITEQTVEDWTKLSLESDGSQSGLAKVSGVTATAGITTLNTETPVATTLSENTGNFYYNALPAISALTANDKVELVMITTYGVINIQKKISEIAKTKEAGKDYAEAFDGVTGTKKGVEMEKSFINNLGGTGKFVVKDIDFLDAIMNGMHVKDDAMLQKMLNYFKEYKKGSKYSESKAGTDVKLYLDGDANGEFRLSQTSVNLIEEINQEAVQAEKLISIQPCTETNEKTTKLILTEGGEVPSIGKVFENEVRIVYLSDDEDWTWSANTRKPLVFVRNLCNEGNLTISASIVETGNNNRQITNKGTITVTSVVEFKCNLSNDGTININAGAELRAYGATITNNAKALDKVIFEDATAENACGKISNSGVLGVTANTNGRIQNYGYIKNNEGAKTYITTNQTTGASFTQSFSNTHKIGTIELTTATDNISVSNATEQGFIKYTWNKEEAADENGAYKTPSDDVKYNYLIVNESIEFLTRPKEIKFIQIGSKTNEVVITTKKANENNGFKENVIDRIGFILPTGCKANLKEGNTLHTKAAYVKGTFYVGGDFAYNTTLTTYFGGISSDAYNIVKYQ